MFKILIFKEIHEQLTSLRFVVGLLLSLSVTLTATVILTQDYQHQMADYRQRISMQNDFLDNYAHSNRIGPAVLPQQPPGRFSPLIIGLSSDDQQGSFDDNPLPTLFPPLDMIFIVTIVLSLLALLLSYDAVCGERQNGTLKLQLANNVKRATIILSKWLGGTVTLFIPFLLALFISTLYVFFHPAVAWHADAFFTLLLLAAGAMTFLSAFYLLGLWISAKTRTASVSILVSLFIWVLWTLTLPNLSPYIAAQFYKIPSVNRVEKEVSRLMGIERDQLGRKGSEELSAQYQKAHPEFWSSYSQLEKDALRQRVAKDAEFATLFQAYQEARREIWREANRLQGEKAQKLRDDLNAKANEQTWTAKHIACLSPYACFVYLATDLTGTGMHQERHFGLQARHYFQTFRSYLSQKEDAARQADPTYNSNRFIDVSDRPRFHFQNEALAERVNTALPYWALLLLFNAILLGLAIVDFIKYDVR